MAESFRITPAPSTVSITPGGGASGFTSRALVFGDASGALTNNSSAPIWDSTLNSLTVGTPDPSTLGGTSAAGIFVTQPTSAMYGIAIRRQTAAGTGQNLLQFFSTANASLSGVDGAGRFLAADGSTASAGLSFLANPSVGMFRVGNNDAALTAGGAKMIEFTSNQLAFFGAAPAARASSYTTSASTATRTVPTTVTTATQSTVDIKQVQNAVNDIISVLNNMVGDNKSFGFTP